MKLRDLDITEDEFIERLVLGELKSMIHSAEDTVVKRALHIVIAYCSVPGTYMEGAYDGANDS